MHRRREQGPRGPFYESIGIGLWQDFPSLEAFRGELDALDVDDFMKLHYRFANLGNIALHLRAPPPGNALQRKFLEEHGEGVFHLGFTVPACDAAEERARSLGLAPTLRGRLPNRNGFTYFDSDDRGAGVILQVRKSSASARRSWAWGDRCARFPSTVDRVRRNRVRNATAEDRRIFRRDVTHASSRCC